MALRRALYRNRIFSSDRLLLPVIVVGNISVGGTGKTPLTLALAGQLVERGWHPLIISRGYGSKSRQPQHVAASATAQQVGDEPLLMARRDICPVWIGKDRAATAHAAMQATRNAMSCCAMTACSTIRLQRDVEIAVIDGARGFGNGFLLPARLLREPVSRLQAVDAVVINDGNALPGQCTPCTYPGSFSTTCSIPAIQLAATHFQALRNHAVAGIGHPQRYFQHLENGHPLYTARFSRPSPLLGSRSGLCKLRCDTPDRKRCGKMHCIC